MVIGSEQESGECSIALEDVLTLQDAQFMGPATWIQRSPDGWFYFVDSRDGLVTVHHADGEFFAKVGRKGAGPGEYECVRNIVPAPDNSLFIIDGALSRASRFSRGGEFLGSVRVPVAAGAGLSALLMPDGRFLVNDRPARAATEPIHVLKLMRGNDNSIDLVGRTAVIAKQRWLAERLLGMRADGEILVAHPFSFTIDVHDTDFTKTETFTRVAEWTPSEHSVSFVSDGLFDTPLTPMLRSVWEDERRLVWLVMIVPSPAWKPAKPRPRFRRISDEAFAELAARPRVETIIEVVDLARQTVMARARFPGSVGTSLGSGIFATSSKESTGNASIRITRARLHMA